MHNLWIETESRLLTGDSALRVYSSRLLGCDKSLVLHGGGNTSVKIIEKNAFGEDEELLYVKGSGWDLEKIEEAGFSPVRLDYVRRLAQLPSLPDPQMVNELVTHMTRASAPVPSVEAILHAILPYKYVDHTHADAVIAITNTLRGESRIQEIYGDLVVVIPYVMPGFDLARLCAERFPAEAGAHTIGMVLLNHGIFSFGETAKESYERMIKLVGRAEDYLKRSEAWDICWPDVARPLKNVSLDLARLRREISDIAGFPVILARHADTKSLAFAARSDVATISQQGPATPDHVIRTKRVPMLGRDVKDYAKEYGEYFSIHEPLATERKTMLDAAPRIALDPELGMCTIGRTAKDAAVVAEIYSHTMEIILQATALGGYRALPAKDIFDVEYWDLEQAKLRKSGNPAIFAGEVALVTGAASGIGKACVDALLSRGAAVVGLDINPKISTLHKRADFRGILCDVTSEEQLKHALEKAGDAFGGLDMLILNAGIFPGGCHIDALKTEDWQRVMQVNLDANLVLLRECHPLLKLAPRGGRVVVIGSKNVPAPGPGAAAYSVSKAALTQLMRVAALEWGGDGIRINSLHPNAVFDTGIWTEEVLASRARHYGLSVEEYTKNNVLRTEVTSRDVAELAAEMCGPLFAKTTAAQVPVDGGNDRVI
ncbi:Rhamnose utilisation protein RhaD, predicted bifunctional aldolase and dehydrogenase [Nitrosospira sp. Nl5]|uniref:bifunctional aldolase/short-chain dehydrogenase n=1 Tax=Nitrosospira sp. Nl5 TaxID=200120 RepID=UPI0008883F80|nr:bifunctional aldolase/short-chain dehydrogenase [Nitrosospira sp. Nl5]SCY21148.1 Rhamnose utilisation protein RhaD, predicted bifunctional aldolase and dehydrogenase [Nitrosospira sp. Nl5]